MGMERPEEKHVPRESRQFFNFSFFRVDPTWRWLNDIEKEEAAKKLEKVIRDSKIKFRSYAAIGLRYDTEFLFWLVSDTVEQFQEIMDLRETRVSAYVMTDTPMIVGIKKDIPSLVKSLG